MSNLVGPNPSHLDDTSERSPKVCSWSNEPSHPVSELSCMG